jgi:hypothetical protein
MRSIISSRGTAAPTSWWTGDRRSARAQMHSICPGVGRVCSWTHSHPTERARQKAQILIPCRPSGSSEYRGEYRRFDPGPNRFDARAALDDYKAIEKRKSFKTARVAVPAITTWTPCIARACLRMVRGCVCLTLARACDWWHSLYLMSIRCMDPTDIARYGI